MAVRYSKPLRVRLINLIVGAGILLVPAAPIHARSWQSPGGWEIIDGDDNCAVFREFDGKGATHLLVILYVDGNAAATLSNTGWSASKDETYELAWDVNGNTYAGTAVGVGERYSSRKGFAGKFGGDFVKDIAAGSSLDVYRGDIVVDQLKLDGSGAAIAVAQRCLQTVRATIAAVEREKQRFAHIPDDPFAGDATKEEAAKHANEPPRPLGNAGRWATNDDYPATAMREEREGSTSFKATISPDGRVSACDITQSSGHADLDAETCKLVIRRARFQSLPGSGQRFFESKVNWRIPR